MNIAKYIDHTLLKTTATKIDVEKHCKDAIEYGFYSVCVNPNYVKLVRELLKGSDLKTVSVIGFPFGESKTEVRVKEALLAVEDGAQELDTVICASRLVDGDFKYVYNDLKQIVDNSGVPLKVILETSNLTKEQIVDACKISVDAGVAFVKTSTGFFGAGASVENVKLMRATVGNSCGVKAAGGIRDYSFAKELIDAGANRIGASASIAIVNGAK